MLFFGIYILYFIVISKYINEGEARNDWNAVKYAFAHPLTMFIELLESIKSFEIVKCFKFLFKVVIYFITFIMLLIGIVINIWCIFFLAYVVFPIIINIGIIYLKVYVCLPFIILFNILF